MNDFEQIVLLQQKLVASFTTEEQEQLFIAYNTLIVKRTEKLMTMNQKAIHMLTDLQEKVTNLDA